MPTSPKRKSKGGTEAFSIRDGEKVDDHIHGPILDNPEADDALLKPYIVSLLKDGFSDKAIKWLTGATQPPGFARGGGPGIPSMGYPVDPHPRHPQGMIKSSIPGRTDKIPMGVPPGSYILPADIPSALGEGNTMAGEKILGQMFKVGPYGSGATGKIPAGKRGRMPGFNWMKTPRPISTRHRIGPHKYAEGGEAPEEDIPIIAAGGEYVIHPEQVKEIGHGDMKAGHRVLDAFVLKTRKQHIETLKKLKPPKK